MKQMIVMRTDLNMRKGKMVAQGAHAAVFPFLFLENSADRLLRVERWISESAMTKICVGISGEDGLREIERKAREAGVDVYLVRDAGFTEFHGVPTLTCLSLGPDAEERLDPITGGLKLL